MKEGERQVAPTRDGIRRDHVARYEWAAWLLGSGKTLVDVACGVGYGAQLLAEAGHMVAAFDRDAEAIAYARTHYAHARADFAELDVATTENFGRCDAAVCFETIEHIEDPLPLLKALRQSAPLLLASVPNEDEFPWEGYAYHFRHYTAGEFEALLLEAGWQVSEWHGQAGEQSEVESGKRGRTLIAVARPCDPVPGAQLPRVPRRVAILGLGPSVIQYLELTRRQGGRQRLFDEVWTINALGGILDCDRIFHMDDVRIQEIRAAARPDSNIAVMLEWMKRHPGPIYTSRTHPDYPGLVEYPLAAVINWGRQAYLNNTAAAAVAYAGYIGVKKLTVFGMDFTYPNAHDAEKGRACVEFWLGLLHARGVKLGMPKNSSLMDACAPQAERIYGYDTLDVHLEAPQFAGELCSVRLTEKAGPLPTADEIEARYDHSAHPSPMVQTVTQRPSESEAIEECAGYLDEIAEGHRAAGRLDAAVKTEQLSARARGLVESKTKED